MSGAALVVDFVAASRWVATDPGLALRCLLPEGQPLERRVRLMVAVGTLLTAARGAQRRAHRGTPGAWGPLGALARLFVCSGARVDPDQVRELIAAHCQAGGAAVDGALLDALAERMATVAEFDRPLGGLR